VTDTAIRKLRPAERRYEVRDAARPGFGVERGGVSSNRTLALVRVVFQYAVDREELDAIRRCAFPAATSAPSSPASAC
jgi:hypothetical protein